MQYLDNSSTKMYLYNGIVEYREQSSLLFNILCLEPVGEHKILNCFLDMLNYVWKDIYSERICGDHCVLRVSY